MATTVCTIKTGPYAGTKYYPEVRLFWGERRYSLDTRAGWAKNPGDARRAAEALGWQYTSSAVGFVFAPAKDA